MVPKISSTKEGTGVRGGGGSDLGGETPVLRAKYGDESNRGQERS